MRAENAETAKEKPALGGEDNDGQPNALVVNNLRALGGRGVVHDILYIYRASPDGCCRDQDHDRHQRDRSNRDRFA